VLSRSRSLYLALLGVGYVLIGALRASSDRAFGLVVSLALVPGLVFLWARSAPPTRGEDWVTPVTRSAVRACGFGGALIVAASLAPPGDAPFDAVVTAGGTIASMASLIALSRIAPLGGLFLALRNAESLRVAWAMLGAGCFATAFSALRTLAPDGPIGALAAELASASSGTVALLLSIGHATRLQHMRRADLGAHERLSAALKLGWAGIAIGVPIAVMSSAPASRAINTLAWAVSFAILTACAARDPAEVARRERLLVSATALAAPLAVFAALFADRHASTSMVAAFFVTAGVYLGLASPRVARLLGAREALWIDAVHDAIRATMRSEPEAAMAAALSTLRHAFGPDVPAPELWQLEPPQRVVVDLAGYVQTQTTEAVPKTLLAFAQGEPEQMLRIEVLERLEVRRADVRPPLEWMRARDVVAVMLLSAEEGPVGALLLPRRAHTAPLRLEEVRAIRALGDRLAALLAVAAALARSRGRELIARNLAERGEDRALYFEHVASTFAGKQEALAHRLSTSALMAAYSPAARRVNEDLERVGEIGVPVTLLTPPGADPVPYAALVHGAAKLRPGAFLVVDGADARDRLLSTWNDPEASPLRLADGGTLCILAVAALPAETQAFVAAALAERRAPGVATPLDLRVVVTTSALEASSRAPKASGAGDATAVLEPALAQWLGDRVVALPSWAARREDQRALFLDRIGRLGLRLRGRPMGLDPRALARLVEHEWPGNDAEVNDVLLRAALAAPGDIVTAEELEQIGFVPMASTARRAPQGGPYAVGS
jgi:hypothetical protein